MGGEVGYALLCSVSVLWCWFIWGWEAYLEGIDVRARFRGIGC